MLSRLSPTKGVKGDPRGTQCTSNSPFPHPFSLRKYAHCRIMNYKCVCIISWSTEEKIPRACNSMFRQSFFCPTTLEAVKVTPDLCFDILYLKLIDFQIAMGLKLRRTWNSRAKRARHESDHAHDWRSETGEARRISRLCFSVLARACTPLTKSEENETSLAV